MKPRSIALAARLAGGAYRWALREPILTWGATPDEAAARLPGDELLEAPDGMSTRAIDIDAPASSVWPWIAQMGPAPRGGAYTYDWIENLLGLDMHSADRVLADFQHPRVGESIGFGSNRMSFERVEPERVLAMRSQDGNWVWSFVLSEESGRTRLLSRDRFRLPTPVARAGMIPMEPASLVMERRMLQGIRARAERLAQARRREDGAVGAGARPDRRGSTTAPPPSQNGSRTDAPTL
ncbi:MAG TPA: SRPBCC family protein [Solirubrobacteraceae bacterium]